mgnify:CR=1 FL=1
MHWGIGTILAVMVLISTFVLGSYQGHQTGTAPAPSPTVEQLMPAGDGAEETLTEALPPGPAHAEVPVAGSGEVAVAAFTRLAPPTQRGRTVRVRVEVEREMPVDAEAVAQQAADILQDERSWPAKHQIRFDFVGNQRHDLVIRVLTPDTTDTRCAPLKTLGQVSCSVGSAVNLNGLRWAGGVPDYADDLNGYRTYLVNHEVGHYLGYGHVSCPGRGQPAPVMMQQTKGLKGCARNVWP